MNKLNLYLGTFNNENTKTSYSTDITSMLNYVNKPEEEITLADLLEWKNCMTNEGLSSATIARRIGSVKRYYDFLCDIDVLESNPTKKLKSPRITNKVEPTLTSEDVNMMINAVGCTANGVRTKAIMATLASTGMRVSELISIKVDDFNGNDVNILGKGGKRRMVHINNKTMEYINHYMTIRNNCIDNLFVSNNGTPMTKEGINKSLKLAAKKAGIDKNVHNHSFRHLWATSMLDHNVPLERIQLCMGHSDISVTTRYAKIRNEQKVVRDTMDIEVF